MLSMSRWHLAVAGSFVALVLASALHVGASSQKPAPASSPLPTIELKETGAFPLPAHFESADIAAGRVGFDKILKAGFLLFHAEFNGLDGVGSFRRPDSSAVNRFAPAGPRGPGSQGCAECHNKTDPIGFGLENYDRTGAYRTADKDNPQCTISGDGEVAGLGTFNGPAELADLIAASGNLEGCLVTQLYRMALGRRESDGDASTLTTLTNGFKQNGRAFDKLLVEVIADPAFIHRQLEP